MKVFLVDVGPEKTTQYVTAFARGSKIVLNSIIDYGQSGFVPNRHPVGHHAVPALKVSIPPRQSSAVRIVGFFFISTM